MRNMRRMFGPALLSAGVIALVATSALAQRGQDRSSSVPAASSPSEVPGKATAISQKQRENAEARIAVATAIADRFAADAKARGLGSGWRQATLETLLPLSLEGLRHVEQQAFNMDALAGATKSAAEDPNLLGDPNKDLVYTPIAPCRYIDTRFYAAGKINGDRGFDLSLSGASYGASGACNMPVLFGVGENSFGALAMNITVVDTSAAGSPGFLAAKPNVAAGTTSLINWFASNVNVQVANQAIVTTDQAGGAATNEFVIHTSGAVHVIVDIFGAFIEPQATALQFVEALGVAEAILNGATGNTTSANCPAGYTLTGGSCLGFNFGMELTTSAREGAHWFCAYRNTSGVNSSMRADAMCARVPGR